ncbi:MAG: hypothetical protein EAX95_11585 [Candidatus Thorarchaeota archaeon]|nr:hypothetical protein [Candidatus Thorarchaeota archaeon]
MTLANEDRLEELETRANALLRELGFGVHEALVIVALNQVESSTVSDLSTATGVHHANLYSVLDGLVAKGIVISHERRPKTYEFAPLRHFRDLFSSRVEQLTQDLELIQNQSKREAVTPTLIYTISGRLDVETKMLGMISKAKSRILLVAPNMALLGNSIHSALGDAASHGVNVRLVLGDPLQTESPFEQRIKKDSLAVNLVVDGEEALIAMPDLSVCGFADNTLIALQLEGYLEQTWNMARKYRRWLTTM